MATSRIYKTLLSLLLFLSLTRSISGQNDPPVDPCDPDPCEEGKQCHGSSDGSNTYLCLDAGYRPGSCSTNAYLTCDEYAACTDTPDNKSFTCQCQEGATGDGFKPEAYGTGCQLPFKPCSDYTDCPEYGYCDQQTYKCACKTGFEGNGFNCTDINECLIQRCDPNAICQNSPGNFTCTCDALNNFVGDGFTCVYFCYNDNDCDVPRAKCGANNRCQCVSGYQGDGLNCTDIDECAESDKNACSPNADCVNNDGSYYCECKNGFVGDGMDCEKRPQRCDEISNFKSGAAYIIDPDFTGPARAFEVICDRISGITVTKVPPTDIFPLAAPENNSTLKINYKPATSDLVPFTQGSVYCYQDISFSCYTGFALFPGTSWFDPQGHPHENWGSNTNQQCACGEVRQCRSSCYCDGTQTTSLTTDSGQIVEKSVLPIVGIRFQQAVRDKGRINIGNLICAQTQFNVPKDCYEAKFKYSIKKNSPLYIDVDGNGGRPPFLAFCDMESYSHVGITSIPSIRPQYTPTTPTGEQVMYSTDIQNILGLIDGSVFCSQKVEFMCKNSRLTSGGGYVSVTGSNQRLSYFPGANGQADSCGCGATRSCDDPLVKCNCDIEDDRERKDFGLIINKEHLPVVGVTAMIGDNRSGTYVISNIKCSQKQFGIEPNCEKYRSTGETMQNYTYHIDPDGPGGLPPFLVECQFQNSPPQGLTIVHHTEEKPQTIVSKLWSIYYLEATANQIEALKNRSTICIQNITLDCIQFGINTPKGTITWTGGGSSDQQMLPSYLYTCGNKGDRCNCRSEALKITDFGTIADHWNLPVTGFDFSAVIDQLSTQGELSVTLGPLVCSEVFPTCAALKNFLSSGSAVEGEAIVVNGKFTIDPDGAGGVDAFQVTCTFPTTVINVEGGVGGLTPDPDNPGPISTCFDINYKNDNGDFISAAQVTALVQASAKCRQDLMLECQNAPATNKVSYKTCDGKQQTGWAGSYGQNKCACGVNGNCDGGPQAACNCDMADNVLRSDSGSLINKSEMPVCQICFSIDPILAPGGGEGPTSVLKYKLGELKCDTDQGTKTNCQDARRQAGSTIKTVQEMSVSISKDELVPVGCRLYPDPPVGILVVKASKPANPPSTGNHTDVKVIYITISISQVRVTFKDNEFCSQNVFLFNATEQNLQFGGNWGFFTYDGHLSKDWVQLNLTSRYVQKACDDYKDLCSTYGPPKGFSLTNKDELPVSRILLSGGGVIVVIGDVECLDLKKSCQEILDTNSKTTGFISGKKYAIDPDGSREIAPFTVNCEFDQVNGNGVSEVVPSGQWAGAVTVIGKILPGSYVLNLSYDGASPEQINALAKISGFCWQRAFFTCRYTPLVNRTGPANSFYELYGQGGLRSFGTGDNVDFPGCACGQTGTCISNYSCNCDALMKMAFDQGSITSKDLLPITKMYIGGQSNAQAQAKIQLTPVRCSLLPIDPPRDCADALKRGSQYGISYTYNGEYLISPNPRKVKPFMAYCEIDTGFGVTVIRVVSDNPPLDRRPGAATNVSYYAPSLDQLQALIQQSKYCYQGVRYDCRASSLFSQGGYWLSAGSTDKRFFWGGGQPSDNGLKGVCACGQDKNCGGLDSAEGQRTRPCNCEVRDNTSRADAGIINIKDYLPLTSFVIGNSAQINDASLTIGDLYCSQEPLKFDECDLGFHDCHNLATCVDQDVGYRCVCPPGWNGKGVVVNNLQARANGRECIDDDECVASRPCPYSATCTNTPGDFYCTCKPGYTQTGKTSCQDINECANATLNDCDPNARCENLDGSFRCICNRGFRGDGRSCIPVGKCVCFGDPHCISFDHRWLHGQDECDYVLAQDGCTAGQLRTFRIEIQTWKRSGTRPGKYSYVKSVTVYVFDKQIRLEQGGRIVVDGLAVSQYYDGHRFSVTVVNQKIRLRTVLELEVLWDRKDVVEVSVPKNARNSVCGLCGNYNGNSDDDWTLGPACSDTVGKQTTNPELFVQSWTVQNSTCPTNCHPDQPPSTDDKCFYPRALVERECNKLFDVKTSPFKDCLNQKTSVDLSELRGSCVYDLCHVEDSLNDEICRFAEILAWDCSDNEKVNTSGWKSKVPACEETKCPNSLIYKPCSLSVQRTCLDVGVEQQSIDTGACVEGCFCSDNQVLEGDRCINSEQCGCFYENSYLATGDSVILPDCSKVIQCQGNKTSEYPVKCGENEECRTIERDTACYCKEGYSRHSEGACKPDVCYGVECHLPNMECVNATCVCKEGYIGDCKRCEDVDECETSSACNLVGQTCVNTEGSYRCVCEEGFIGNGYNCKDIDECEYQIDNCGANSECVNTRGGFLCECCAGYSKNKTGQCVRDTSAGPVAAKCCACQSEKCNTSGQVCGTDGKTYSSFRSLSIAACRTSNDQLKVNYKGPCKGTCETVVCNKHYSTCEMKNGIPTCICPTCSDVTSSYEDSTVCASNKVTYISKCHMEAETCEAEYETKVEVEYTGRPCTGHGPPLVGPWSNWSACSEDCKQGVRTRTRPVYINSSSIIIHSVETVPCYSTCDQGPCSQNTCTATGQVCTVDENNAPSCSCPICDDFPEDFICARLGYFIKTYPNECELNKTACELAEPDSEILEPRACEEKPVKCGLIRKYNIPSDSNGCKADRSINFGECYGGCDDEAELCCFGNKEAEKSAILYCPDGSSFQQSFTVITECNCITKAELDEYKMKIIP